MVRTPYQQVLNIERHDVLNYKATDLLLYMKDIPILKQVKPVPVSAIYTTFKKHTNVITNVTNNDTIKWSGLVLAEIITRYTKSQ